MTRFLAAALAALSLLGAASAARAADKPLVYDAASGQPQELPSGHALQLRASASGSATVNEPQGSAPSTPVNGDRWTTSAGFYGYAGGVTYGPFIGCGSPFSVASGQCGLTSHGLAFSYLPQVGGSSYLGNQSTTTGDVTAYAWPTCVNDGAHALVSLPSSSPPIQCLAIGGVSSGSNPFFIGVPDIRTGAGSPAVSADPVGSLYMQTDVAHLYQQVVASGTVPAIVQSASASNGSVTLASTPASGDLLIAVCYSYVTNGNGTAAGWTNRDFSTENFGARNVSTKQAGVGESATQTPCTSGGSNYVVTVFEVSGVSSWSDSFEKYLKNSSPSAGVNLTISGVTDNASDLVLAAFGSTGGASTPSTSMTGITGSTSHAETGGTAIRGGTGTYGSSGSAVSATYSSTIGAPIGTLIFLKPPTAGWKSIAATWKNAGTALSGWPLSVNCSTGTTCTVDTSDNVTLTAAPATNSLALSTLAQQSANTMLGNWTGSTANVTANAMPSCSDSGGNHLNYVAGTGVTCGTAYNASPTLSGLTLSGITGSTQCLHVNTSGVVSGTAADCGAGGGGGTTNNYYAGSLTWLGTCTPSGTGTCTFASIPSGYTDLLLSGHARSTTAGTATDAVQVQFNADTGSNYGWQVLGANGSATPFGAQTTATTSLQVGEAPRAGDAANYAGGFEVVIPNYSGSSFAKTALSHYSTLNNSTIGSLYYLAVSGQWNNTAAVTSLTVKLASGNYVAGSTISLYGRGGGNVTVNPQPGLPVICEVVTSGSQTSVTVGGGSGSCPTLPSTYRDLRIVANGRSARAATNTDSLKLQLNGDSGTNYSYQTWQTVSTATSSAQTTGATGWLFNDFPAATASASHSGRAEIQIGNYAGTTFFKPMTATLGSSVGTGTFSQEAVSFGGQYLSTSAVTSLTLTWNSGAAFQDGTVITVYGLGGSPTATLPVVPPQGRLTLTSGAPVMTADATAQTTIYYTPFVGALLPVGNIMYRFSELSYALNTTAHASGSLYDVGAFNNSGTIALCTAPAWTNATTRAAAVAKDATNGIWTNSASLTCNLSGGTTTTTIAAGQWTYLGTFYATANGQTGMAFKPTAAAGGTNNILGLSNAYNRVTVRARSLDSTASWSVNSGTWASLDASSSNRISFVDGLQQSRPSCELDVFTTGTANSSMSGCNLDSTTAQPAVTAQGASGMNVTLDAFDPQLGFHYLQAMQASSAAQTYYGVQATPGRQLNVLRAALEMHLPLLLPLAAIRRRRRAANDDAPAARAAA